MKLVSVVVAFVLLLATCQAAAWSKEDYEIFKLNDKIVEDLGAGSSFYSWLGLENGPKSTLQEITKAYRKKSRLLHPDKFSGKSRSAQKHAEERFQRLSLVGNILRDQSLKKRYDYFLSKGFPKWKGTGYFYTKFRPGLILTAFGLYLLISAFQFISLRINRKQDYKRILQMKEVIKSQAWGGSIIPPADGSDRKLYQEETGKSFVVKVDGSVWIVDSENNDALVELDESEINVNPGFKESYLFKFPAYLWNHSIGRISSLAIDTSVVYHKPDSSNSNSSDTKTESKTKAKKKVQRGEKKELANGTVVYARPSKGRK
ncbi:DnaJ domain-containing protein [Scheffersomyces amazonensis]|uniref:DnaJ domain-containing protein n=1 Tax=Scheffersomyces amazonensis TaxID=1078765 RepID=UPI00315D365D